MIKKNILLNGIKTLHFCLIFSEIGAAVRDAKKYKNRYLLVNYYLQKSLLLIHVQIKLLANW